MALTVLVDACIGCGGCEYACPTGALTKTDSFLGLFAIDPFLCDDCGLCVSKCPEDAIRPDPAWPVCHGHGCPLSSARLAQVECNIWQQTCPGCGGPLWRGDASGVWACPRCDGGRSVGCPKVRHLATAAGAKAAATSGDGQG
ncbi:MAG: indolepyruvate ferredoxin oxidoreductase subunit alpha [Acidimicrobiia bacterium]|jgi:ferredoxin